MVKPFFNAFCSARGITKSNRRLLQNKNYDFKRYID